MARTDSDITSDKKNFPVFFFHGLTGNSREGFNFAANLTAEGRVFVPLAFCERECSLTALNIQVPMAIAAVRQVVANDDRFVNGYIFMGHSQGGMMARAVIEQMDDHKVHTFVSLAGALNGMFYGLQDEDRNAIHDVSTGFGAKVLPSELFNFAGYSPEGYRGKMQYDLARRAMDPKIQAAYSIINLARTPVRDVWLETNEFLPMINNVIKCVCEANSLEEIESGYEHFTMVEMCDTVEYREDTFGLRTLDERGALSFYTVPGVPHCCWLYDSPKFHTEGMCEFYPLYDEYVYKVLS
ncbi:hypothetical protein G195_011463 [Phytophthora kernoviae 00238/432]|uniref:Uncharacterized protein n=2 Tax=Phytophthora kernoviae TaxID=325452 RepID=A0A8J4RUJ9_9STRA|nr:hypothetical protein G195_011463 [Phytophthora kernoviae 00238/432]